jgi:hypothetical protein
MMLTSTVKEKEERSCLYPESIFNMMDGIILRRIHRHDVEAAVDLRQMMLLNVSTRYPRNLPLFPFVDPALRRSKMIRQGCLDLDEHQGAPIPSDNVNLPTAVPIVPRYDLNAFASEKSDRHLFSFCPQFPAR